jgi:hypothetical protein
LTPSAPTTTVNPNLAELAAMARKQPEAQAIYERMQLHTLRAHGLLAEPVALDGDRAAAVRALTERIKGLLPRS